MHIKFWTTNSFLPFSQLFFSVCLQATGDILVLPVLFIKISANGQSSNSVPQKDLSSLTTIVCGHGKCGGGADAS